MIAEEVDDGFRIEEPPEQITAALPEGGDAVFFRGVSEIAVRSSSLSCVLLSNGRNLDAVTGHPRRMLEGRAAAPADHSFGVLGATARAVTNQGIAVSIGDGDEAWSRVFLEPDVHISLQLPKARFDEIWELATRRPAVVATLSAQIVSYGPERPRDLRRYLLEHTPMPVLACDIRLEDETAVAAAPPTPSRSQSRVLGWVQAGLLLLIVLMLLRSSL